MLPGDRLICAFTGPVEAGQEFRHWLLHVTIVPWFRTGKPSRDIAADLAGKLAGVIPFEAVLGRAEEFGHNRGKSANLIVQPTPFMAIEAVVRQYLHGQDAWIADDTTQNQRPFIPHVTVQESGGLAEGDSFRCQAIFIVEQLGGGRKQISSVINLRER